MFGPSDGALSGSSWLSMNRPLTPTATAARASTGTNSRCPPELPPRPPGCCTEWVASKITGWPRPAICGRARMSETSVLYPNDVPRSVSRTRSLPAPVILAATCFMSQGARNWPFFTLIAAPVAAAARSRSVCRHRKAGICSTSITSAAGAHCSGRCTSLSTGQPNASFTASKIRSPSSMPTPRAAFAEVRLALS